MPTQSSQGLMSKCVKFDLDRSNRRLQDSLDDQAFRRLPEVGAAPDMINDDLPSNPDYLDASFGTAAGFRELRDDDLDEFDVDDIPISAASQTGVISNVGGETIRILSEEGIRFVENYFNKLPHDSADDNSQYVRLYIFTYTPS
jgi:autophagy-related protein 2